MVLYELDSFRAQSACSKALICCLSFKVVLHTGLPKDQIVADSLIRQVKERFGDVVHVSTGSPPRSFVHCTIVESEKFNKTQRVWKTDHNMEGAAVVHLVRRCVKHHEGHIRKRTENRVV